MSTIISYIWYDATCSSAFIGKYKLMEIKCTDISIWKYALLHAWFERQSVRCTFCRRNFKPGFSSTMTFKAWIYNLFFTCSIVNWMPLFFLTLLFFPFQIYTGWLKSFESDTFLPVEESKFIRYFNISSSIWTHKKFYFDWSIHSLFTSHLKLTCQCILLQWKKPNIVQW